MKTLVSKLVLLCLVAGVPAARAVLPEPANWVFGSITLSNVPAGAARADLAIEARRATNGPAIARYVMGSVDRYGDLYFLELPIETGTAQRNLSASTNGSRLYLTLVQDGVDLTQTVYQVPDRGQFKRLDLTLGAPALGSFSLWAAANNLSGDGSGDQDGDGVSDLREYIAGTNPNNANDAFSLTVEQGSSGGGRVWFQARQATGTGYAGLDRFYALEYTTNLPTSGTWLGVPNFTNILGNNALITYLAPSNDVPIFYRGRVWLQAH